MVHKHTFSTIDAHAAGEPFRVIIDGIDPVPGDTMIEKRQYAIENLDTIRTALMWEPRGHADMYGAIITEPVTPDGDLGVLFLHNAGFSTMCGHGIIALLKVALDAGLIHRPGEQVSLNIDSPAGRIRATARRKGGEVATVSFTNVPSFVHTMAAKVDLQGRDSVPIAIAFGGAFYAFCDASAVGIEITGKNCHGLLEMGRFIKKEITRKYPINHPTDDDLGFLYGTIFIGPPSSPDHHSKNVCVFADGEVDRSPTGTGVSARAAIHYARGELGVEQSITIESILGTTFTVKILKTLPYYGYEAVVPEVSGWAHITGESKFYIDSKDPLRDGFFLR